MLHLLNTVLIPEYFIIQLNYLCFFFCRRMSRVTVVEACRIASTLMAQDAKVAILLKTFLLHYSYFSLILFLGSALLTHGSYIKIGCLHFTFSIVQQNAPPAISSAFGGTKKEQVALADGGDAVKTEEPLVT